MTQDILPPEVFEKLTPEYVAPVVAYLCTEEMPETASVFIVGGGKVQRVALLPSVQQLGRAAITYLGLACLLVGVVTSCTPSSPSAGATTAPVTATVLRAVDGDTLDVRDDNRGRLRVRLLGIDSPEVHKPGWSVGCWGPEAARFAADTLTGQRVALVADPEQDSHDRYGRTLSYVELADGRDFAVAAAAGMARSYVYGGNPVSRYPEIAAADEQARAARRGLWGPPCDGNTESTPL